MQSILSFLFRSFISLIIFGIIWPCAYFGFDQSILASSLLAILGGGITNFILKKRGQKKLLKENQLTKKEYQYISQNMKEADQKIKRLNKTMLSIRSFRAAKLLGNLQRLVKQIFQIVKKEPKRFYQAERFFFYHLDSVVELSERYVFLSRQNIKDLEVRMALSETEQTLEKLVKSLNDDLLTVLSNDIETLNMELDVAKQTHDLQNGFTEIPKTMDTIESQDQNLLQEPPQSIKINFTDQASREKNYVPRERR